MRPAARRLALALALFAGLAQAMSIAAPWSGQPLWWLQMLSLGVLAWQVDRVDSVRRAAWLGWVFATAWLAGTFWWLFISMHTYGGLPAPLAVLAVLGLAAFLALYYAAACGLYIAWAPVSRAGRAALFAALWTFAELARGHWFTGFPWGAGGYAHVDGPLAVLAKFVGVYGLGTIAAVLAWLLLDLCRKPQARNRWLALALVVPVVGLALLAAKAYSVGTASVEVALLQGNIPQDEKFQGGTGVPVALEWYGQQLRGATAPLVIAPETAIPMLPQQLPDGYWDALRKRFTAGPQAALVGVPLGSYKEGYTNSVVGLKPGAEIYQYDKHHLVPFGEFIPPFFRWFTQMMNIPLGDFNRGAVGQASFLWQGQRLAPNICYEDLFGEELGARFADPAQAPTIFVNVSNIGWFGNTVAIDQHLQISRMRALEFERPMIRATNTGASVIIDHRGRVTHALPRHTRGVLVGEVEGRIGTTPFAWWVSRFGLWPLWLLAVGVAAFAAWAKRSSRSTF
ncbi:MAG TPA: apolipoprotein N-acyltransferase [Burkholderiaceae bacterium]|nr:apolipoprotein N-acyltransferase [Burkholderiaceae bacterium]